MNDRWYWGRAFRLGHRYTRRAEMVWLGTGWSGCINYYRHWWRFMA